MQAVVIFNQKVLLNYELKLIVCSLMGYFYVFLESLFHWCLIKISQLSSDFQAEYVIQHIQHPFFNQGQQRVVPVSIESSYTILYNKFYYCNIYDIYIYTYMIYVYIILYIYYIYDISGSDVARCASPRPEHCHPSLPTH